MPWITIPLESFHKRVSIGKMSRNDDRSSCANVIGAARDVRLAGAAPHGAGSPHSRLRSRLAGLNDADARIRAEAVAQFRGSIDAPKGKIRALANLQRAAVVQQPQGS